MWAGTQTDEVKSLRVVKKTLPPGETTGCGCENQNLTLQVIGEAISFKFNG